MGNIAPEATFEASSEYTSQKTHYLYSASKVADGIAGAEDIAEAKGGGEWVTRGQRDGAWIRLSGKLPRVIHKVVLRDRVNPIDRILDATVEMEGVAVIRTGELPNDGAPREIQIAPPVKTAWVLIRIQQGRGINVGLSEVEIIGR